MWKRWPARIHALGPRVVVVTGGHREEAIDVFFDGQRLVEMPGPRHPDGAAHGSGCTHSSVLAARLAHGDDPLQAARDGQGPGRREPSPRACSRSAPVRVRSTSWAWPESRSTRARASRRPTAF